MAAPVVVEAQPCQTVAQSAAPAVEAEGETPAAASVAAADAFESTEFVAGAEGPTKR